MDALAVEAKARMAPYYRECGASTFIFEQDSTGKGRLTEVQGFSPDLDIDELDKAAELNGISFRATGIFRGDAVRSRCFVNCGPDQTEWTEWRPPYFGNVAGMELQQRNASWTGFPDSLVGIQAIKKSWDCERLRTGFGDSTATQ